MNESNELKNLLSTLKIKSNAEVDDKNNPKENYLNNQNDSANINRNFLHLRYCLYISRNNNNLPIEYQKELRYSNLPIAAFYYICFRHYWKLRKPSFIFGGPFYWVLINFVFTLSFILQLNGLRICLKSYNSCFSGLNQEQIAIEIKNLENNKITR